MKIKILKASYGDCIFLSFNDKGGPLNILIDGGIENTYHKKNKKGKKEDGELKILIECIKAKNQKIDLLILTHIDKDHIEGILEWFRNDETAIDLIGEIWFNGGSSIKDYLENNIEIDPITFSTEKKLTSVRQGIDFEKYINDKWDKKVIQQLDTLIWNNIEFNILSPDRSGLEKLLKEWKRKEPESLKTSRESDYSQSFKELIENDAFQEDTSVYNGSSIAFILKYNEKQYLFLADAHPSVIISGLKRLGYDENNKLNVEFVKLSHHGSKKNNPIELLKIIETDRYIISTDGSRYNHPDKATIARIASLNPEAKIYFNYPELIDRIVMNEDKQNFPNIEYLDTKNLPVWD